MAAYDSYLLTETGGRFLLEDGSGSLLLEIAMPVTVTQTDFFDEAPQATPMWDAPLVGASTFDEAAVGASIFDQGGGA